MAGRLNNVAIWVYLLASIALFIPLAHFVERQDLFEVSDAILIATNIGICITCSKSSWSTIKLPFHKVNAGQCYVLAIFLICTSLALLFAGQWLWRVQGKPDWIADSLYSVFNRWLAGCGLLGVLALNWTVDGVVTPGSLKKTALLVTGAVAGALITFAVGNWTLFGR